MENRGRDSFKRHILVSDLTLSSSDDDNHTTSDALLCTRSKGSDSAVCKAGDEGES